MHVWYDVTKLRLETDQGILGSTYQPQYQLYIPLSVPYSILHCATSNKRRSANQINRYKIANYIFSISNGMINTSNTFNMLLWVFYCYYNTLYCYGQLKSYLTTNNDTNSVDDVNADELEFELNNNNDSNISAVMKTSINMILSIGWHYCNKPNSFWGSKYIVNNKRTFECTAKRFGCCFARCNIPMKPNFGIYKIRFKINTIRIQKNLLAACH